MTHEGTLFLVLNTNYYYRSNNVKFEHPSDPADQFAFMESELKKARSKQQPVHILAHISPGMYERMETFCWLHEEYNARFLDIVATYRDVLKNMIFGHHHSDTFHVVRVSLTTQLLNAYAPSIPGLSRFSLPSLLYGSISDPLVIQSFIVEYYSIFRYSSWGGSANNPAFRMYIYNSNKDWRLKDIRTYYVDLTKLNQNPQTEWQLEYSFKEAYALNDFSPQSFGRVDLVRLRSI